MLPPFVKISLRVARVAEDVDPYGFDRFLESNARRGGACSSRRITIPPSFSCENATSLYTREALLWLSPCNLVSPLLLVGTGVLDCPRTACQEVARGRSKNAPTDLIVVLIFVCKRGFSPPALFNAMSQKAFPCEGRGTACGG